MKSKFFTNELRYGIICSLKTYMGKFAQNIKFMKKSIICFISIWLCFTAFAQTNLTDLQKQKIYKQSVRCEEKYCKSYETLAKRVTIGLTSEEEKLYAIYVWIAENIKYDYTYAAQKFEYPDDDSMGEYALKLRQGVCSNYAHLFRLIAKSIGLKVFVVDGYSRPDHEILDQAHSWNVAQLRGKWYCFDVTWGSSRLINNKPQNDFSNKWFMVYPEEFLKSHMPFDPMWQLSFYPVSFEDFENKSFAGDQYFNFPDTISKFTNRSVYYQITNTLRRIQNNGKPNVSTQLEVVHHNVNIRVLKYNFQIEKIKRAVAFYNNAIEHLNAYIEAYNRQFYSYLLTDKQLYELLDSININIKKGEKSLEKIVSDNNTILQKREQLHNQINEMNARYYSEKKFVDKYIATAPGEREKLFYK